MDWQIRKTPPRAVAVVHQRLKFTRCRDFRARRARSSATLDRIRMPVLTNSIGGFGVAIQSSPIRRRATKATTKARKMMPVETSRISRPTKEARRSEPRGPGASDQLLAAPLEGVIVIGSHPAAANELQIC